MGNIKDDKICELEKTANQIRSSIIEMLIEAKSGHTAGPLGMADIFTYLYLHALKHDPKNPDWGERDILVLSNGHICPLLYTTMAYAGYFPKDELKTLRKFGSRLQGHPHREYLDSLETSSGPLGSGLSQAVGMALAMRIDQPARNAEIKKGKPDAGTNVSERFVYCMMSDGELNEGQSWEAVMLGAKEKLHNLIAIVDRNNIQIDGFTEDIMPLNDLVEKFESFNWHVQEINGHDFEEIDSAIQGAKTFFGKPSVIIANTIPGKGVEFMERRPGWHGSPPGKGPEDVYSKDEQGKRALKELRSLGSQISCNDYD